MKNFKNIGKNVRAEKLLIYFKDLTVENILLTLLLLATVMILTGNILRVVANAKSNYEIFHIEAQSLDDLQKKQEDLKKELEYVSSDEYKMLLLRNSANMALSNEELYAIRNKAEYLDEEKELLDLSKKSDYKVWWEMLWGYVTN